MKRIILTLSNEVNEMTIREHFYFWIGPAITLGILMLLYFSQVPFLMELVSPTENWEWGILENLQLLIILCIFFLSGYAVFKVDDKLLKVGFGLISVFALFVFLEETDYGAHYIHLLSGKRESLLGKYTGVYNLHNKGNNAKLFKRPVYLVITLLFLVLPFTDLFKEHKFAKYIKIITPTPRMVFTVFVLIMADIIPRFIVWFNIRPDGGLGVNIGEFSELIMYYLFFLYLRTCFAKSKAITTYS